MLSQSFSKRKLIVRALLLIPLVGLCVLFFNQGIVAQGKISELMMNDQSAKILELRLTEDGHFIYRKEILEEKRLQNVLEGGKYASATIEVADGVSQDMLQENPYILLNLAQDILKFSVRVSVKELLEMNHYFKSRLHEVQSMKI